MDFGEHFQDVVLAGDFGLFDGFAEEVEGDVGEGGDGDGGVADVPGFGGDSALVGFVGEEKAEAGHVFGEPEVEFVEDAAFAVFDGEELDFVAFGAGGGVDDVDFGAPVVAAGAGEGGPVEDGAGEVGPGELGAVDDVSVDVVEAAIAVPFGVPDGGLFGEIAEDADGGEVDSVAGGCFAHCGERCGDVAVERHGGFSGGDDVGGGAAGEFERIHGGERKPVFKKNLKDRFDRRVAHDLLLASLTF